MGYSHQQFYEIRRDFQTYGVQELLDKLPGATGPHQNRVSDEIEKAIMDYCLIHPTYGCLKAAQQLSLQNIHISYGDVRRVWQRNKLTSKHQ